MTATIISQIPLDRLADSPFQPRTDYPSAEIDELAASIRAHGVLQPLLAIARGPDNYELVCGHRRKRAAQRAGLDAVPVMLTDLPDAAIAEAQLVENLQRAELDPLDAADALLRLHREHGKSIAEIMAATGLSRTAIYNRFKLTTLGAEGRAALRAGQFGVEVATLIARVPSRHQAKAVELAAKPGWNDEPRSYREVRAELHGKFACSLKDAIFDTAAAGLIRLPDAAGVLAPVPACIDCPRRSGNAPELFGDIVDKDARGLPFHRALGSDVCTDPDCYGAKRDAHLAAEAERLRGKGKDVVTGTAARRALQTGYDGKLGVKGDFVALAEVRDAVKAHDITPVVLQDPASGKTVQAVRKTDLKAAGLAPEKKDAPARRADGRDYEAERKQREERAEQESARRRAQWAPIRAQIEKTRELPRAVWDQIAANLLQLVRRDNVETLWNAKTLHELVDRAPTLSLRDLLLLIADCVGASWCDVDPWSADAKGQFPPSPLPALAQSLEIELPNEPAAAWTPQPRRKKKQKATLEDPPIEAGDLEPAAESAAEVTP